MKFVPAPGWPVPPDPAYLPPMGWVPDAAWPAPPAGWVFYVDEVGRPVAPPAGAWIPVIVAAAGGVPAASYPSAPSSPGAPQYGVQSAPLATSVAVPSRTKKRLSRKALIGIIAGVLVLALGIGGGVWLSARERIFDSDNIHGVFSQPVYGVVNATEKPFMNFTFDGRLTGAELRVVMSSWTNNDCLAVLKRKVGGVKQVQALEIGHDKSGEELANPFGSSRDFGADQAYLVAFDTVDSAKSFVQIQDYRTQCVNWLGEHARGEGGEPDDQAYELATDSGEVAKTSYLGAVAKETEVSYAGDETWLGGTVLCGVRKGNLVVTVTRDFNTKVPSVPRTGSIDCRGFAQKFSARIDQVS